MIRLEILLYRMLNPSVFAFKPEIFEFVTFTFLCRREKIVTMCVLNDLLLHSRSMMQYTNETHGCL